MYKSVLIFLFLFVALHAGGQSYPPTARSVKELNADNLFIVSQVASDSVGNTFWGGAFMGSVASIGSLSVTNTHPGYEEVCLFKFGSEWDERWAKSGGGAGNQGMTGLATDAQRNCYFAILSMQNTLTFDNVTYSSPSNEFTVVFKYSSAGNRIWAHQIDGVTSDAWAKSLTVDPGGNLFFGGAIHFFTGASDGKTSFVRKIGPSGNTLWTRTGDKILASFSYSLQSDSAGNCLMLSSFTNSAVMFGDTTLQNRGKQNYVLVKYDSGGTVSWARRGGGAGPGEDRGIDVVADQTGDIYVLSVVGSTNFLFTTDAISLIPSNWMLAKYSAAGAPLWAKAFPVPEMIETGGIALDTDGGILITASSKHGEDFSSGFLAKCSSAGALVWKKHFRTRSDESEESTPGAIWWRTRPVIANNGIYVAGANFVSDGYLALDSLTADPRFLIKFSYDPQLSISRNGEWLNLSWPTNEPGFFLESSGQVGDAAEWVSVTNSIVLNNDRYAVTNAVSGTNRFYRLQKTLP